MPTIEQGTPHRVRIGLLIAREDRFSRLPSIQFVEIC